MKVIRSINRRPPVPPVPVRNGSNDKVVISDSYLIGLNRSPTLLKQFPFLKINVPITKGCRCNEPAVKRAATQREMERIRQSIADMAGDTLAAFKTALNTKTIVVFARKNGAVQRISI